MDRKDGRNTPPKLPSPGMARLIATYERNKARRKAREKLVVKLDSLGIDNVQEP